MTRKDYVRIAGAINKALQSCQSVDERHAVENVITQLELTLLTENPRFNPDRFKNACRGEK